MNEKYITENGNSFVVRKASKTYGKFQEIGDAVFFRDILIESDWNLDSIDDLYEVDDNYIVSKVIDDKICLLGKYERKPSAETIERLAKRKIRNPNNSRYGLNITKIFDTFTIKKQIAGDDYIFGFYDNLEDAEFVRNFLLDNQWNVNAFSQIEHDEDSDTYKVIEVIDDRAYVIKTADDKSKIDLKSCHEEFLAKISKHKYGLATHSHLDELTGMIGELEERFGASANDDVWSFEDTQNPLNDMIFNMTPFQKSVYDAIDGNTTFDEITQSLIRFRSKNFTSKVQRNLDELIEMGLVSRDDEFFKKT